MFELVRMTGGLPNPIAELAAHMDVSDIAERRYAILRDALVEPPVGPVGEFFYSNLGYVVAGAMAEALTGQSWETLMEDHLFAPLDITSVGFGPPGTLGAVDQPWGMSVTAWDGGRRCSATTRKPVVQREPCISQSRTGQNLSPFGSPARPRRFLIGPPLMSSWLLTRQSTRRAGVWFRATGPKAWRLLIQAPMPRGARTFGLHRTAVSHTWPPPMPGIRRHSPCLIR